MSHDHEEWVQRVNDWGAEVHHVPSMIRADIMKSKIDFGGPKRGYQTLFEDPLAIQYALGYKDRQYSLSFDVLKRIVRQLSVVGAIINTRVNQVASFAVPFRNTKSLGFVIKHKNPSRLTTKGERDKIMELEDYIYQCGHKDPNPHNSKQRDDFESFLKKIVRDSLTYDQCSFEVVPDRRGIPYEFVAVDGATIRMAAPRSVWPIGTDYTHRPPNVSPKILGEQYRPPYQSMKLFDKDSPEKPDFVQVINGRIENVYTKDDLAFGVRNPRTDIYVQGYGFGELEQLITIVTGHLNAEEYNRRFFTNGSNPKGILNFKGDNFTPDQIEGFKREWKANIEGVANSHKLPVMQSENGIEWVDMSKTNQEMEFGKWMEYLIKITCAVFLIDPAEINFDLHGGVSQTPLFESSNEYKLKASRDRGLRPMLRFIAKMINENIIAKIDDHFVFDFIGLDELSEQEKHELRKEQVTTYYTLNEVRRAEDLPDVEHGDMVMSPTYLQAMQISDQKEQLEAQTKQAEGGGEEPVEEADQTPPEEQQDVPSYADGFSKSFIPSDPRVLEIDLDDWMTAARGEE